MHPNFAVVHFDQLFDDGQAKTGARSRQYQRIFTAEETIKDAFVLIGQDAYAVVPDVHLHEPVNFMQ